jgi:hypothetical protein
MKKLISARVRLAMQARQLNNSSLARAMRKNRVQVQRLLDPQNASCSLATLASAFSVLGLKLDIKQAHPAPRSRLGARRMARPRVSSRKARRSRVTTTASSR